MTNDPLRMPLVLLPKVRSPLIMATCHQCPCSMRIGTFIGIPCSGDVMGVHLDGTVGKGMGTKVSELAAVAGCDTCHKLWDGRDNRREILMKNYAAAVMQQMLRAVVETHSRLLGAGIISVKDGEIIQ